MLQAGNTAARTFTYVVLDANDQGRPVKGFYQARRRNADDAGVPLRTAPGDEHAIVLGDRRQESALSP